MIKIFLLGLAALLGIAIIFVGALLILFLGKDLYRGAQVHSPNREFVAQFYGLGGGGAAGWAFAYLQIEKSGDEFEERSNLVLTLGHGYQLCLDWIDDNRLLVQYPSDAVIEQMVTEIQLDGSSTLIHLEYRRRPSKWGKFIDSKCAGTLAKVGGVNSEWVIE